VYTRFAAIPRGILAIWSRNLDRLVVDRLAVPIVVWL